MWIWWSCQGQECVSYLSWGYFSLIHLVEPPGWYSFPGIYFLADEQPPELLDPVMDHYSRTDWFTVQETSQSPGHKSQPALSFILQL